MRQLTLFSAELPADGADAPPVVTRTDDTLLAAFQAARLADGAHARSARREVSQLRALLREAQLVSPATHLHLLFSDLDLLAHALREPSIPISRATGRARLLAAQRLLKMLGPQLGRDPDADLATLDARLPTQRSQGWHTTGTLVAGAAGRRRRRGPTLHAADLQRLVESTGAEGRPYMQRDRALVALHCFSGLRPEEIIRLRWDDFDTELPATGHYSLVVGLRRGRRHLRLILPEPAARELQALAASSGEPMETRSGPVFLARGISGRTLSYHAARDIVETACRHAGLPPIAAAGLRAACAHWLRGQGLSDLEVAAVLGLARVCSVDRLLQHHEALIAQRRVRDVRA